MGSQLTTWSSPTRTPTVLVRISVNSPESAPPPATSQSTVHLEVAVSGNRSPGWPLLVRV
ncbi:hypothetical protein ABZ387_31615 [Streptomyces flaveolus]|uniref:hypothetical protein n=1 Tax=Streptomyces flaveolus TaxID=67297 RepID=UPI003404E61F